ncbi:hypothetical protein C8R42DRAFT_643038 [Lentinula raphanica]|nr:hypothetical protein C8R42DRAFT_643038 [Lentinula raphanica]
MTHLESPVIQRNKPEPRLRVWDSNELRGSRDEGAKVGQILKARIVQADREEADVTRVRTEDGVVGVNEGRTMHVQAENTRVGVGKKGSTEKRKGENDVDTSGPEGTRKDGAERLLRVLRSGRAWRSHDTSTRGDDDPIGMAALRNCNGWQTVSSRSPALKGRSSWSLCVLHRALCSLALFPRSYGVEEEWWWRREGGEEKSESWEEAKHGTSMFGCRDTE